MVPLILPQVNVAPVKYSGASTLMEQVEEMLADRSLL